jgi:hypothetical protein
MLFQQVGPTTPPGEVQVEPPMTAGPMTVELVGLSEARTYDPSAQQGGLNAELRLQFRLRGDRLHDVVRYGRPIFTEFVDSTGAILVDPNGYTPDDREETVRQSTPAARLEQSGVMLDTRLTAPARQAQALVAVKGSLRVIYAGEHESVYIDNPRQYQGGKMEHPRLAANGVEIEILPEGDPERTAGSQSHVAARFTKGSEKIREVVFVDSWFNQIRSRAFPMPANDGHECLVYYTEAELGPDYTMVIEFYPKIEDVRMPFEFVDLPLP